MIGANSFSGSHFVKEMLERGSRVLGISRSPEPIGMFLPRTWVKSSGNYEFLQADINNEHESVAEALFDFRPTVIVNFASQGMVAESWVTPWDWYQTNLVGLSRLTSVLERLTGLERYVHVTTPEVYGSTSDWISESFEFSPSTPYAVSRAAGDWHLMGLFREKGLPVVFTRAANVYGPGQQLYRIIPRAFIAALLSKPLQLHGGGKSVRSFIHIDDVVDATIRIAQRGEPGSSYHISTNETVSISALVSRVFEIAKKPRDGLVEIVPDRVGKDQGYLLNSERLRRELDWNDSTSLDSGLLQVMDWISKNLEEVRDLPLNYEHKA